MTIHLVKLLGREDVAEGTVAFRFQRPADFNYKAGQTVDIALNDPPASGDSGLRHTFSLVSAPYETDLLVATRMRDSAFKRKFAATAPGTQVQLEGPFGSFTLHSNPARPAVFVAGGIGITPFMSILRQVTKDRTPRDLRLIYSNRRPEDTAFLSELKQIEKEHNNFRLFITMTGMARSRRPWAGDTGHIDEALLRKATSDLVAPIYYVAGPPAMVAGLRQTLNRIGVDDDDIRSEDFAGY
jgi:ferredoxin-NADP reductase